MNQVKKKKVRIHSLDILRGTVVFTMILAHTIAFLYSGNNNFLRALQKLGDLVSFTTFLLVSGGVTYIAYLDKTDSEWKKKRPKFLKRIFYLLISYYFVGLISSIGKITAFESIFETLTYLAKVFFFIEVPGYTEFLIAFVLFGLSVVLFRKYYLKLVNLSPLKIVIFGLFVYFIGFTVYKILSIYPLVYWTSFLFGYENWYRFPIFQYFIVFAIGFSVGKYLLQNGESKDTTKIISRVVMLLAALLGTFVLLAPLRSFPYEQTFNRWPPSISFILGGLVFALTMLLVITVKFNLSGKISKILEFWGKKAFDMYIFHVVILILIDYFFGFKSNNPAVVLVLFIVLILGCSALSIFEGKIVHKIHNK